MSISDLIVVMKQGRVQQIGKPQQVYDDPVNLFVAQFLGTPPINVFDGEVKNQKLYIGGAAVLDTPGVGNQKVTVGIRPEGFLPCEDAPLVCDVDEVEVMGRDVTVVCRHPAFQGEQIRAIVSADRAADGKTVRFRLKPGKVHLFDRDSGQRVRFGG